MAVDQIITGWLYSYKRVDIAADTYQKHFIKSVEKKIEEMQVKYLLNQQSQKFWGLSIQLQQMYSDHFVHNNIRKCFM